MNTYTFPRKTHHRILTFVVVVSLLAHAGTIFWLQGLSFNYSSTAHSLMERHLHSDEEHEALAEETMHNEQLRQVFNQIVTPPKEHNPSLTFDMKKMPALVSGDILATTDLPMDFHSMDQNALSYQVDIDSMVVDDKAVQEQQNMVHELPLFDTLGDLHAANKDSLANELIQQAEQRQEEVSADAAENVGESSLLIAQHCDEDAYSGIMSHSAGAFFDASLANDAGVATAEEIRNFQKEGQHTANLGLQQSDGYLSGLTSLLMQDHLSQGNKKSRAFAATGKAASIASSDDFTLAVDYIPKSNGQGYLFRLQLIPKDNAVFKRITHNVFFLVDRSYSIPSERYEKTKRAILQSLSALQDGDTFNILVFDSNIVRMSANNIPRNGQNFVKAQEFLSQQASGSFLSTTDLYSSLGNIVPVAVAEQEVNTAILFSDGDPVLGADKQRTAIGLWTRQNRGKVSLYCIAAGEGNCLSLLDLLSAVNKGKLYYSVADDGIGTIIYNLLQGLRHPIGKEIVTSVVLPNAQMQVDLFPAAHRMPNLYQDIPYVVYGSTNTLEDFHVFFQGKYYDRWLDIKQLVSFQHASLASGNTLERLWALQKAYDYYDHYLYTGDINSLKQGRSLLHQQKIPIPF